MAIRRTSTLNNQSVGDPNIDAALRNIVTAQNNLAEDASLNTGLIVAAIGVTATPVRHNLGHPVQTWEVVRKNAVGDVYESATLHDDPSHYINLVSSSAVTVTLRFS